MAVTYRNAKNGNAVVYDNSMYTASSDTTAPVMVGSLSSSNVTTTSFTLAWQAATDAVGVTGYEVSLDNGSTYTDAGNVLTVTKTGLTQATVYNAKVRAYDAAGNRATSLSLSVTTATSSDTTAPILSNATASATGQTTATGNVSTDEAGGTLFYLANTSATATADLVKGTGLSTSVTALGAQTVNLTGLTPGTLYYLHFLHRDAATVRNDSIVANTNSFTTTASSDTVAPIMTGAVSVTAINSGGFTFSYTAATDNVAATGYEASVDTGTASYTSVGNVTSVAKVNLSPSTLYNIRVRAFDAAGNRSNIISTTATTAAVQSLASAVTLTFKNRAGVVQANLTGMKWAFFDAVTPDALNAPSAKGTGASTNSSGILTLNITGTQLPPGSTGWLIFSNSDGTASQSNLISFAGPCVVA